MTDMSDRWASPAGQKLAAAVLVRLASGISLDALPLDEVDGRTDLRGLPVPDVEMTATRIGGLHVSLATGFVEVRGAHLRHLDFSGAHLPHLRFFDSTIEDCRFDAATCQDWRIWSSQISDTTFVGADLRHAMVGAWPHTVDPWTPAREVSYQTVDFSRANLRDASCGAVSFTDCEFAGAVLVKFDFDGASFVRCHFAGLLDRVTFHGRGFRPPADRPPNPMEEIDMSEARLHEVEFRGLDLGGVRLPQDHDHLVVRHLRCVLERMLAGLPDDASDEGLLRVRFEHKLKWAGQNQDQGVFARADLTNTVRDVDAVFDRLRTAEADCARDSAD